MIYKFFGVNHNLFDTLINNQLFFSSIRQFNDPYDCRMFTIDKITEEDFRSYLDNLELSNELNEKYLVSFRRNPEELTKPFIELYDNWLNYLGICCFTKEKNNTLLWSHYTGSHRGVCLGFDYELMTKTFTQFDEVDYNDDPFPFNIKEASKSIRGTILRKSKDWSYEKEIRFLSERSKSKDFPQDALVEVNFGSRCTKRDMLNIQHLVLKLNYRKCNFYKARINDKMYKIEFAECDYKELKKDVLNDSADIRFKQEIDLKHLL